jgi:transcriptional activator
MEAHLALGDRSAALRSYHRYAEILERDLALQPDDAIAAIYRQLRTSTLHREELQDEDVAPVAEVPLMGRDLELDQLNEAWIAVRDGRAHLVLLSGEPGIGSPASPWSWDGAFEPRDTWWLRLGPTRRQADCRGARSSTSSDPVLSVATSTRWARSGGPNSLVFSRSSSRVPQHLHLAAGAIWLSAIGYSMQ